MEEEKLISRRRKIYLFSSLSSGVYVLTLWAVSSSKRQHTHTHSVYFHLLDKISKSPIDLLKAMRAFDKTLYSYFFHRRRHRRRLDIDVVVRAIGKEN